MDDLATHVKAPWAAWRSLPQYANADADADAVKHRSRTPSLDILESPEILCQLTNFGLKEATTRFSQSMERLRVAHDRWLSSRRSAFLPQSTSLLRR